MPHFRDYFVYHSPGENGGVLVDTYRGDQFPEQCATREFIADARKCLHDDGVLGINWMGGDSQKRDDLTKKLESIVGQVWQSPGVKTSNVLYFATPRTVTNSEIVSAATTINAEVSFENSLKHIIHRIRNLK